MGGCGGSLVASLVMEPTAPEPDSGPAPTLTIVGGMLLGLSLLVCVAVVAGAAFVGIPIPGTGFTLRSVGFAVIAGIVVGGLLFFGMAWLFQLVGIKVTREPGE
jgi:hypothetical protein